MENREQGVLPEAGTALRGREPGCGWNASSMGPWPEMTARREAPGSARRSHHQGSGLILNHEEGTEAFQKQNPAESLACQEAPWGCSLEKADARGGWRVLLWWEGGWREMPRPPARMAALEGADPGPFSGSPVTLGKSPDPSATPLSYLPDGHTQPHSVAGRTGITDGASPGVRG